MRGRIKLILLSIFLIIIAAISIYYGLYFQKQKDAETIIYKSLNIFKEISNKYLSPPSYVKINDTVTIDSNLKFNLSSEIYKDDKASILINNLNKLDTNILIQSNEKEKKALFKINSNLGEENILDFKKIISNSTDYYYLGNVNNQYINNGTSNYFENLLEDNTTKDNLNYLKEVIFKSFINNLDDNYLNDYEKNENILENNKDVYELTIEFNETNLHHMLNNILKDLKKDKKANLILTNYYPEFPKLKIDNETSFLQKKEYYMLHIYTTKTYYEPLKFRLDHMNGDDKESYVYEIGKKESKYYYLKNDNTTYQADILFNSDNLEAKIRNSAGHDVGEFKVENNKEVISILYKLDNKKKRIEYLYTSKYMKEKDFISNEKELNIKELDNNSNKLSGIIVLNTKLSKNAKIIEDLSNTVLSNSLSEDIKNSIKNYPNTIKNRLES